MWILKRAWQWFDDRTGTSTIVGPIARHPVPPGTGWWYVFGSATLFAFIVQVVTGIALAAAYVPSTAHAYQSLQFITQEAVLGRILRGTHFFGASAMVLFIGIHMIRVFLMGAYKFPREVNWLTGAGLLLFTLGMGFTGQLLRWDQNAVWSVVVGAEQAGRVPLVGSALAHFILAGDVVGGATLSRFFAFHVFFIPALIFAFVGVHLYLVMYNGISEPPQLGDVVDPRTYRAWYHELLETRGLPFWPDVAWRDVVFGIGMIAAVVLLAWIFGPPQLGKPPDPTIIEAYPRPDWYFLWFFAVLALLPHGLEDYVIVLGPLIFGLLMILLPFIANKGERSPWRRPWSVGVVLIAVLMVGTLWIAGERAPWSPNFQAPPLPQQVVGATSGAVAQGAQLFQDKGCQYCHRIAGYGGERGPDLTSVGDRLTPEQMTIRILNGGYNMPAYGNNLAPDELNALVAFLQSRKSSE
ncbi:MAG: cytochrome b N-terminal domain-containing protein [Ardenticatenaceae bacterium]|nr:cytochrome b N-terminal domain-containing protein [Ardenticatenaceae bacterium]